MNHRIVVLLLLAACGSSSTPVAAPAAPAAPVAWKDMNAEQRGVYMKDVVLPRSKEIFVAFDAVRYGNMDCKTCHGDGVDDGSFEMPNPKIKPLPDAEAMRFTTFMSQKVEPLMGELLGVTVFDPKTSTGEFSCMNCHQLVNADGVVVKPEAHAAH
jgi:hypothetical protein